MSEFKKFPTGEPVQYRNEQGSLIEACSWQVTEDGLIQTIETTIEEELILPPEQSPIVP